MILDDPFAEREADAGSLVLATPVQTTEEVEDLVGELHLEADPIITDAELVIRILLLGGDLDVRRLCAAVLESVADEILKELGHLQRARRHGGKLRGLDG